MIDQDDEFCCSIYLLDHAWTYRVDEARRQLDVVDGLLSRMVSIMDIDCGRKLESPRAYQDSNGRDVEVRLNPFHCAFSFNNYYQSHHKVVLILLLHCLSRVRQAYNSTSYIHSPLYFPLFLHSCPNPSKSALNPPIEV